MSQCFQSFILSSIWCILSVCIFCLYLFSTIVIDHKEEKDNIVTNIFIPNIRQLSSIRKVVWLLGGKLGKFWRSGITCITSVFLSAPTGQQTSKLEYWKTQKLHKLGQASNHCWDLKKLHNIYSKIKLLFTFFFTKNHRRRQCVDIMPIDAS